MRRQYLILMALLCAVPLRTHSQELDYFPLQPGNYWTFRVYDVRPSLALVLPTERIFTISVIADTSIFDQIYHRIVQPWTETFLPDTMLVRAVPPMLFCRLGEAEALVHCFSSPTGSNWTTHLAFRPWELWHPYRVEVISREPLEMPVAASVAPGRLLVGFNFRSEKTSELEWDEVYALGIGPVYIRRYPTIEDAWDYLQLDEAFIDSHLVDLHSIPTAVRAASYGHIKHQARTPGGRDED